MAGEILTIVAFILTVIITAIVLFVFIGSILGKVNTVNSIIQGGASVIQNAGIQAVQTASGIIGSGIDFMNIIWVDLNDVLVQFAASFQQVMVTTGFVILDYLTFLTNLVDHRLEFLVTNVNFFFKNVMDPVIDTLNNIINGLVTVVLNVLGLAHITDCSGSGGSGNLKLCDVDPSIVKYGTCNVGGGGGGLAPSLSAGVCICLDPGPGGTCTDNKGVCRPPCDATSGWGTCASGSVCVCAHEIGGICQGGGANGGCIPAPTCTADGDCPVNTYCSSGTCVYRNSTCLSNCGLFNYTCDRGKTPPCPNGSICSGFGPGGFCITEPCTTNADCFVYSNPFGLSTCINNQCR